MACCVMFAALAAGVAAVLAWLTGRTRTPAAGWSLPEKPVEGEGP